MVPNIPCLALANHTRPTTIGHHDALPVTCFELPGEAAHSPEPRTREGFLLVGAEVLHIDHPRAHAAYDQSLIRGARPCAALDEGGASLRLDHSACDASGFAANGRCAATATWRRVSQLRLENAVSAREHGLVHKDAEGLRLRLRLDGVFLAAPAATRQLAEDEAIQAESVATELHSAVETIPRQLHRRPLRYPGALLSPPWAPPSSGECRGDAHAAAKWLLHCPGEERSL
mmetsp:Transcript_13975/g.31227  ORF Transcript_13975/g.31227 Transcript_13975/m.31227 type:complete len:231 (-) Transcript_13975:88-780(-)